MSRSYSVSFTATAITTALDLFEISPAANKPVRILGIVLGQTTELGDAQEEQLEIRIVRGHTTSGSGGSATTPVPLNPGDPASGFSAEILNTTIASIGTTTTPHVDSWNVRSGYAYIWTPEMTIGASAANTTIVVRLVSVPADSITITGTLYIEEL